MGTQYGLTSLGFVAKQQAQIILEINAQFQSIFGANINLGAESVFGQIVGVFSEREALLWQLGEAIYDSQYPAGAEGTSVDNILALNNLTRLQASPTVTNPTPLALASGITLYGLVLFGTPGTTIPSGSNIQTTASPPVVFTLDTAVTIASASNAVETIFFSNTPTQGSFTVTLEDQLQNALTTNAIPYNALASSSQFAFIATPASSSHFALTLTQAGAALATGTISTNAAFPTAATVQSAIRGVTGYSAVVVTGGTVSSLSTTVSGSNSITVASSTGMFVGQLVTGTNIPANTVVTGIAGTTVTLSKKATGSGSGISLLFSGYFIAWGSLCNPLVSVSSNTTTTTLSVFDSVQAVVNCLPDATTTTTNAVLTSGNPVITVVSAAGISVGQGVTDNTTGGNIPANTVVTAVNGTSITLSANPTASSLADSLTFGGFYPFTDVVVTGQFSTSFVLSFGAGTAVGFNPATSSQAQAIILEGSNSLQMGNTVTNLNIIDTTIGAPAQGVGTATCTVDGPNFVAAGSLTVIGSPISGWSGVTNQIDCITGTNLESDTDALVRRSEFLAAQANGPIQAIVEKVQEVPGVTAAIGFTNLTGAAQQTFVFSAVPVSGTWELSIVGQTTSALAYNCLASDVAAAINALTGYTNVLVSGTVSSGFVVDFNGSTGGQSQPLFMVVNNSTGVTITPYFTRPPNSFEVVAQGGISTAIAEAIYGSMPAGIGSYGSPVNRTTGSISANSTTLTVSSTAGVSVGNAVFGPGLAQNTTVVAIGSGNVTLSLGAIGAGSGNYVFNNATVITDVFGNPVQIAFSRPQQVPFYVLITLVTDLYNTPGNSASGLNPNSKFQPGSISTIQQDVIDIGNGVSIGGLVIGFGTNGLIGAFNNVPGIVSYTLFFGTAPTPVTNTNIQLQAEQQSVFEQFNCGVSYS